MLQAVMSHDREVGSARCTPGVDHKEGEQCQVPGSARAGGTLQNNHTGGDKCQLLSDP